ncbi:MAG: S9 family peptidase [Wenzhouxiangella sp.]|jgi:dipeptidyl-peptidase-4|nr:S9 family peptidase [Wenzhouxiangella sp.]
MLRHLLFFLAVVVPGTSLAQADLTIERIFASPDLSGPSLRQAELSPAGDRVTFLRGGETNRDRLDLWEYHIAEQRTRVLVAADDILIDERELSSAEEARRERARISGFSGIVEYRWSSDGRFLLFPLNGDIFMLDLAADDDEVRQVTNSEAAEIDPRVSPNGKFVAFVRDRNLWLVDLETDEDRALTSDGDDVIANGMAEFIAQEEMGRSRGFWWSPDSQHIAFLRTDESQIQPTRRFEIDAAEITIVEQRYPFTGTPNVTYQLGIVEVGSGEVTWIDLGPNADIYIPRVAWLPDGQHLSFQRQSRDQKTLELVLAPLNGEAPKTVLTETSDTWINLHDDLRFVEGLDALLWSSERDGHRHIYLFTVEGDLVRRVTQGDWAVDEIVGLDAELGLVYFTANEESSEEKHLYRQSLLTDTPAAISRVSRRPGWHEITMDESARVYIDLFSNTDQPPQISLHSADGERLAWLVENRLDKDHPYSAFQDQHQTPDFGELRAADGQTLRYRITKPVDFTPDQGYPVLIHVYGGPTAQLVTNRWGRRTLIEQYLAQQGYIVFALDNRGVERQGKAFQDAAYLQLGQIEIADQMVGVKWLHEQSFVDPDRIGIFGWSYGGYLALMAPAQHPDVFAASVAVAPVTDWRLYDTHYTERYMGKPQEQPEAYRLGNVLTYAPRISDPLLLIHPMADDNVLFTHSTRLMQRLQEERIQFDLMTYPGEKHGITGENQRVHVYEAITRFLHKNLRAAPVAN